MLDEGRSVSHAQRMEDNRVASLIELEGSPVPELVHTMVARLRIRLSGPEHDSLRRALNRTIMPKYTMGESSIPETQTLEEVETMLAERIEQWTRKLKREGIAEGRQEGRREGLEAGLRNGQLALLTQLLTRRFGPLPEWAETRLEAASLDQLQSWAEAIFDAQSLEVLLGGEEI